MNKQNSEPNWPAGEEKECPSSFQAKGYTRGLCLEMVRREVARVKELGFDCPLKSDMVAFVFA